MLVNAFMHNVVKWPNILQKSRGVHTARFLKYVWSFYNIMHERVNAFLTFDYFRLYVSAIRVPLFAFFPRLFNHVF